METLFTPWRQAYVASAGAASTGECFLCLAASQDPSGDSLVVAGTAHHVVLLNLFPYSTGHLLIAARPHLAGPDEASPAAQEELWPLAMRAQAVLRNAYRPHGFNLGMNLGRCAGAGLPSHYHLHVVPRWDGDTNFMGVTSGVRLVPEDLRVTRDRVRALFAEREERR